MRRDARRAPIGESGCSSARGAHSIPGLPNIGSSWVRTATAPASTARSAPRSPSPKADQVDGAPRSRAQAAALAAKGQPARRDAQRPRQALYRVDPGPGARLQDPPQSPVAQPGDPGDLPIRSPVLVDRCPEPIRQSLRREVITDRCRSGSTGATPRLLYFFSCFIHVDQGSIWPHGAQKMGRFPSRCRFIALFSCASVRRLVD